MSTLSIIQVRIGSTRLPGKALLPILGRPMFLYAVEAAPEPRIVACPATDHAIQDICREVKVPFATHANVDDVLTRFVVALEKAERIYDLEFRRILRITADCPMLTEDIVLRFLRACGDDPQVIYTNRPDDPDGMDLELFSVDALRLAHDKAERPYDREHVTSYLYRTMETQVVRVTELDPRIKVSVDTRDEYLLVRSIITGRVK